MKLKSLLLIFTLIAFFSQSKAQLTADFPDSNFHWNESHYTRACSDACPFQYIEGSVFDSTPVLINNKIYRSLYFKGSNYTWLVHLNPPLISNILNYTIPVGYIYNDKLNKKVYFRESINNSDDQLLYDFSLSIGDVYPVTKQHSQVIDSAYVFRIDTLTDTYGIRRSVKYVSGFGGANIYGSGAIVEGIGTITGLLSNTIYGNYGWSESNDLTCFSYDSLSYSVGNSLPNPIFISSSNSCFRHQYLSVDSKKKTIIKITPNPTSSTFSIDIPDEEATFTIINTLGQSQEINGIRENGQWTFDISKLNSGIYYIKILTNNNYYYFSSITKL